METFIARQPILDDNRRLFAYELLYRGKGTGHLSGVDGDRATSSVLTSAFLTEGLEKRRNEEDRRVSLIYPSELAGKFKDKLIEERKQANINLLKKFTLEEQVLLKRLLRDLI